MQQNESKKKNQLLKIHEKHRVMPACLSSESEKKNGRAN